ncbi:aminotransferase family protein [Halopenitus persicus]|uniref:aminotransferase family protein n=1 Tax=Halopenitus persicus TaxID=1048396 RepID=UPI000BBA9BE0|nr:aspartate aminotransferase family protein [Halopenitus persicus]
MSSDQTARQLAHDPDWIPHWYDPDGDSAPITDGEGARIIDDEGESYLDFIASLYCVNAGHDNQAIIDAVKEQLDHIPYVSSGKENDTRTELARRLAEVSPDPLTDVVFSVSGSEANELAVQYAREYRDAPKVLTRWQSYHGSTYGTAALTADPSTRNTVSSHAAVTGSGKFLPPLPSVFDAEGEELAEQAANHVEYVIRNEGPDSVAAILMEPVAGSSGAYPAPEGYFERLREICDEYGILLIADEVIAGFGRCGEMFAMQDEGVDPDMISFAKGVTSAYVPLAGVLMRKEIADEIREDGTEVGQTFAGHPLGCAAGLAAIDEYESHLIENGREMGALLEDGLHDLVERYDEISHVHGKGLLWGIVVENPETGEEFANSWVDDGDVDNPVSEIVGEAKDRGVLVGLGRPDYQITLSPPLCIDEDDVQEALDALDESFAAVFE